MQIKPNLILLSYLMFLPFSSMGQIRAVASVQANTIGILDSLRLVVTIHGGNDGMEHEEPDLSDFIVLHKPLRGSSCSTEIVGGKTTATSSATRTYTLKPRETGKFIIQPFTITDLRGKKYKTKPLTIVVVEGKVAAAGLDKGFANIDWSGGATSNGKAFENYINMTTALKGAKQRFILATGQIGNKVDKPLTAAYFSTIEQAIANVTTGVKIGAYITDGVPHCYYGIDDTTGLGMAVKAINDADKAGHHYTIIARTSSPSVSSYSDDLKLAKRTWKRCDILLGKLADLGNDLSEKRRIVLTFSFYNEEDRDQFVAHGKKLGFSVNTTRSKKGDKDEYIVEMTKVANALPQTLFDIVQRSETYKGPGFTRTGYAKIAIWDSSSEQMITQ